MVCWHKDCAAEATWKMVLVLVPPAPHEGMARGEMPIRVCADHREAGSAREVLTAYFWSGICKALANDGKMLPDIARSRVEFEPLT